MKFSSKKIFRSGYSFSQLPNIILVLLLNLVRYIQKNLGEYVEILANLFSSFLYLGAHH